jgi:Xaa-Pro aminopeptidase
MAAPERISKVLTVLDKIGIEAILFFDLKNIRYLSGFTGSDGVLFFERDRMTLLIDGRYIRQAKEETFGVQLFEYREKNEGIESVLANSDAKVVGFESPALDVATFLILKNKLAGIELRPVSDELKYLRACKDAEEIARIKRAAAIAAEALTSLMGQVKEGICELDLACELDFLMRRRGVSQVSFDTIAATGGNSVLPHAKPTNRRIGRGDNLMIDYGAVVDGYHSDETCTFFFGSADEEQKKVYTLVKDAHDMAIDKIRAGMSCREIDGIARNYLDTHGFGNFFPHATGHGVGLDVHEPPRLAPKSDEILEAGMIVTVEPGVYLPDTWGIRIEDMVLVREESCEVLSEMSKDLTIIG